mmetsp:Transcript_25982/g.59895  ORF Transcript_25982/g.59895 Transcript_25982/m.59895 type:complete len:311 (+) Transcript_25982:737-1669(+)
MARSSSQGPESSLGLTAVETPLALGPSISGICAQRHTGTSSGTRASMVSLRDMSRALTAWAAVVLWWCFASVSAHMPALFFARTSAPASSRSVTACAASGPPRIARWSGVSCVAGSTTLQALGSMRMISESRFQKPLDAARKLAECPLEHALRISMSARFSLTPSCSRDRAVASYAEAAAPPPTRGALCRQSMKGELAAHSCTPAPPPATRGTRRSAPMNTGQLCSRQVFDSDDTQLLAPALPAPANASATAPSPARARSAAAARGASASAATQSAWRTWEGDAEAAKLTARSSLFSRAASSKADRCNLG